MLNKYEYMKLCDENSEMLLKKIICPCCGHVYSTKSSIDIAFSGDCEDTIRFNCEECGEELVVKVWATEYRVSTQAADDYDKEYAERLKGIKE